MEEADLALVRRAQAGDGEAFDQLVLRHQSKIYSLACRFVVDADEALDLAQEAFVRAYRALPAFDGRSAFSTWLYRITVNMCLNRKRDRQRTVPLTEAGTLEDPLADPQRQRERTELGESIEAAIAALPPKQKVVLILRHFEGLSHNEISLITGRSMGSVKANYFHAVAKLRKALRRYL